MECESNKKLQMSNEGHNLSSFSQLHYALQTLQMTIYLLRGACPVLFIA